MSSRGKGNPHSKNSLNRIALFQQLKAIAEPIDLESEPLWKNEVWRFRLYFHRHVIGEFLNELDIKDVKDFYLIDRFIKKDYKKWVKLETNLWYETWLSIEKIVHIDEQIYKEPWLIFIRVILEMKLFDIGLNYRIDPEEIPSAKTMTRQYQLENESIRYYENPFNQEDAPVTFELLERLRKLAESNRDFNLSYYKKILRSRQILQGFLEDTQPIRFLPNSRTGKLNEYNKRTPQIVRPQQSKPY